MGTKTGKCDGLYSRINPNRVLSKVDHNPRTLLIVNAQEASTTVTAAFSGCAPGLCQLAVSTIRLYKVSSIRDS